MNVTTTALNELQNEAKTFFAETKKQFSSCKRAFLNVDDVEFYGVWGDFTSKKQALEVLRMWAYAFRRKVEMNLVDGAYRVSMDA